MRAALVLCDYAAQDITAGKIHMMGAGWSVTGPGPASHAVAAFIKVDWLEANEKHQLRLQLVDSDGTPVAVPTPVGSPQPVVFPGVLEVPRPAGLPHGSEIDASFVINVQALQLVPGQRYRWELLIGEDVLASEPFLVRSMPGVLPATPAAEG